MHTVNILWLTNKMDLVNPLVAHHKIVKYFTVFVAKLTFFSTAADHRVQQVYYKWKKATRNKREYIKYLNYLYFLLSNNTATHFYRIQEKSPQLLVFAHKLANI